MSNTDMAPDGPRRGRAGHKDMIPLRTYAIPETNPTEFKFSNHLIKYAGYMAFQAAPDLLWGAHGTTSLNSADAFASRDAQHLKRRLYQIEMFYRLDGLPPAGTSVTEEFARSVGYLHLGRITSSFRDDLKDRMLDWLKDDSEFEPDYLKDKSLEEMIKLRPMFVHALMSQDKFLKAVIHPVRLAGGVTLRIATVRKLKDNIARVYTRFHDEIVTSV
jgi:hypothetical protein